MALLTIPIRASSTAPTVRQRVNLDGANFLLEFQWNAREGRWYLHIFDAGAEPIALGVKLVPNVTLGGRVADTRQPGGMLVLLDPSGAGRDPGLDDLSSFALTYREAADLAPVAAPALLAGGGGPPTPGD